MRAVDIDAKLIAPTLNVPTTANRYSAQIRNLRVSIPPSSAPLVQELEQLVHLLLEPHAAGVSDREPLLERVPLLVEQVLLHARVDQRGVVRQLAVDESDQAH